ncbi:ARM repeat-containing protein [Meredithblackwellia eburnea MCA 4105]
MAGGKRTARNEPQQAQLAFNKSLVAKGTPASEQLKRLRELHRQLANFEQDNVDTKSLDDVAKQLISHTLLLHKDRSVKAYTACCLVDILRLYAPEAPYTQAELKDLFQFLFRQLKYISTSTEPHFSEYYYVLESLSNVKSICIVADLDDADDLMSDLFRQSFDLISSQSPKNVQLCLSDILSQLLEETAQLSSDLVDVLLAQFLPKNARNNSAAFVLAVDVCRASADKLQRYVCQYFADVITTNLEGRGGGDGGDGGGGLEEDDEEESELDEDEEDSNDDDKKKKKKTKSKKSAVGAGGATDPLPQSFITAHHLIKQIHRSVPTLLLNVIPQLEEELTAERPALRKLATETLAGMAGEKPGQGDLADKYPAAWKALVGRVKDVHPVVRMALVESLPSIWKEHPELKADVETAMLYALKDSDDKVRLAACAVFDKLDYETISTHVSKAVLFRLNERCLDTKANIRLSAFNTLGKLYDLAFSEIESGEQHALDHFGWIATTFMGALRTKDNAIQNLVSAKTLEFIVPFPKKDEDEQHWVDRLLVVLSNLEENQVEVLLRLSRLSEKRRPFFESFISVCEKNNGGIIDKDEEAIKGALKKGASKLAERFAPSENNKVLDDLNKFAKANEKQLYKVLRTLIDPQLDIKTQIKVWKDCQRRLEQVSPTIVETFSHLIRQHAFLIINRSSISTLLQRLRSPPSGATDGDKKVIDVAARTLRYIAKHRPVLFTTHVAELGKNLGDAAASSGRLVTVALHALSRLAKADGNTKPDKKISERAKHFAKEGTADQAKYAATIIALDKSRPGTSDDVLEYLADSLPDADEKQLVAALSALNRIARFAPDSYENKSEQITTSALEVINRGPAPGEVLDDEELLWVADSDLDDLTKARILAVKMLASRCMAYAKTEGEAAEELAVPVFQLLWPLLHVQEDERFTTPVASRMRLVAAISILKLAVWPVYSNLIAKRLETLARVVQDPCFEVRNEVILKFKESIATGAIKVPRFSSIFFMVAHDPEPEIIDLTKAFVRGQLAMLTPVKRQAIWEHGFLRLAHLLAHHPDFSGDAENEEEIKQMAKYIDLFVELIVTKENISYVYHVATLLKIVSDKESAEYDQRLYILADLSLYLLQRVGTANSWPISTHPNSIPMPADIFNALSKSKVKEVSKTVFVSTEILEKIAPAGKAAKAKPKVAVPKVKAERVTPKKRASPRPKTKGKAKKAKKNDKWNSDEEDGVDESSDDDDDDDEENRPAKKVAPPAKPSARAALARGKKASPAKANGKDSPKRETRGVIRGLAAPRALIRRSSEGDISDLSDGDGMDED